MRQTFIGLRVDVFKLCLSMRVQEWFDGREHSKGMRIRFQNPEYCEGGGCHNTAQTAFLGKHSPNYKKLSQTACFLWPLCSRASAGCFLEFLGQIWGPFFNGPCLVVSFIPTILHNRVSFVFSLNYLKTMGYLIIYIEGRWIFRLLSLSVPAYNAQSHLLFIPWYSINSWSMMSYWPKITCLDF